MMMMMMMMMMIDDDRWWSWWWRKWSIYILCLLLAFFTFMYSLQSDECTVKEIPINAAVQFCQNYALCFVILGQTNTVPIHVCSFTAAAVLSMWCSKVRTNQCGSPATPPVSPRPKYTLMMMMIMMVIVINLNMMVIYKMVVQATSVAPVYQIPPWQRQW